MDLAQRIADVIGFSPGANAIEDRGRWWTYADIGRLRDQIEQCASRKFLAREFEGTPPGIFLRSLDFRN